MFDYVRQVLSTSSLIESIGRGVNLPNLCIWATGRMDCLMVLVLFSLRQECFLLILRDGRLGIKYLQYYWFLKNYDTVKLVCKSNGPSKLLDLFTDEFENFLVVNVDVKDLQSKAKEQDHCRKIGILISGIYRLKIG